MPKYRVYVDVGRKFAEDTLVVYVAAREHDVVTVYALSLVKVFDAPVGTAMPATVDIPDIPREACEAIFSALAPSMIGTTSGDYVQEIAELRTQLARTTKQLEDLIAGIGRLGNGKQTKP